METSFFKQFSARLLSRQNLVSRIMSTVWSFYWHILRIAYSWVIQKVFFVGFSTLRVIWKICETFYTKQRLLESCNSYCPCPSNLSEKFCFRHVTTVFYRYLSWNCDYLLKKETTQIDGSKNSYTIFCKHMHKNVQKRNILFDIIATF